MTVDNEPLEDTQPLDAADLSAPVSDFSVSAEPEKKRKYTRRADAAVVKSAPGQVVSGEDTDAVSVAALAPNPLRRKSLSVHHLQRRLVDLGYTDAGADVDGRFGELTASALAAWQADTDHPSLDHDTVVDLFEGDPNVHVVV